MVIAFIGVAALIAQLMFFIGFGFFLVDAASLPDAIFPDREFTAEEIAPYLYETIASYRLVLGVGLVGGITGWILILKAKYWPRWYLRLSRICAWAWLPFVPIGTALGVLLLSARSHALESQRVAVEDTPS